MRPVLFSIKNALPEPILLDVVDIGANPIDGDPPYAKLLREGSVRLTGFEPNPDAHATLEQSKGPNETYLPLAVGDGTRQKLHVCRAPGMTSLLPPNPKVLNLFHGFPMWGQVQKVVDVDTVRLDDCTAISNVDMIKIDVQGYELEIFRNATNKLSTVLAIQTEVEMLPMYENQPLFADVDTFLRSQGFMLHTFAPIVSRIVQPLILSKDIYRGLNQVFWADAVYIRDLTKLEVLSTEQLMKLAVITHEIYGSVDIAYHVLREVDARQGTSIAVTYLQHLAAAQVKKG